MNKQSKVFRRVFLVLSLLSYLATLGCCQSSNGSVRGEQIDLKVSLHGWHDLRLDVENPTTEPIHLFKTDLPWEWRYSILIKAFTDDAAGSELDERLPIADLPLSDLPEEKVRLLPGKALHGRIDLRTRFPDLEETLKKREVIVFWSYLPKVDHTNPQPRLSGSLTIPKFR
jgi:hypothetical protein